MNVRAWIEHLDEFIYPESDGPRHLSEFWAVIEGYRLKNKPYEINWGTYVIDKNGNEVYSGDEVRVFFDPKTSRIPYEDGVVEFIDGCFVVINNEGLYWDISNTFGDEDIFKLEITGHVYEQTI